MRDLTHRLLRPRGRYLALALAVVALAGCSDTFDPTVETDQAFAVFGVLDGRESRQVLRVQDLAAPLGEVASTPAPTVTSTELASGRETVWRDSLVILEDGGTDRVAIADLEVGEGETHRIEIVGADGRRASATVVLSSPTASISSVGEAPSFQVDVVLSDFGGRATGGLVRYRIRRADGSGERDLVAAAPVPRGAATISAFLATARGQASQLLYGPDGGTVALLDIRFEATVTSDQPVALEGGVGGIGWVVPVSFSIPVAGAVVMRAGFLDAR